MRYTITVTSQVIEIDRGGVDEWSFWEDRMRWHRVSESTVSWFADSCKAAVGWYATRPAVTDLHWYNVRYSTVIIGDDDVEHPGTVRGAELCNLSYADVCGFQRFALEQLGELIEYFEARHAGPAPTIRRRSPLGAKLALLWGVIRA